MRSDPATCLTQNLTGALAARALPASWFFRQGAQAAAVIPATVRVLQIGGCLRIADDAAEQYAAVLRYTGAPAALRTSGGLRADTSRAGARPERTAGRITKAGADLVDRVRELVAGREREGEVAR